MEPVVLLLKNGDLYSPDYVGVVDVLVLNGKIAMIGRGLDFNCTGLDVKVLNLRGMHLVPGFIDNHVHIIGGGGEAGFHSRTPEVMLSSITQSGITTVVGVIGTDGTTRHLETLLAKARALTQEGITAYIYTGSYELPLITLTGSTRRDIVLIDEVIGTGEIAISDHRSSVPTVEELTRIASDTRVGGMLCGRTGVLNLHMGGGREGFSNIFRVLKDTEISIRHFLPTHITRSRDLFEQAKIFATLGGTIDMTAEMDEAHGFAGAIGISDAVNSCLENGIPIENITISSDGNGSMAVFDREGQVKRLIVTKLNGLYNELKALVVSGLDLSAALRPITSNVARALGLPEKGRIAVGCDADITVLDGDMQVNAVIARGRMMVEGGLPVVKGTFEDLNDERDSAE
ncbi:MAG: beta-aspartyl-peptidase [Synergistaceae bacterium]|jgi:beta-aspartyl-dipeptidase (metallo-type)|nr:beta-aspartyl-peptidase [Synergistaceae bacterium]